MLPRLRAEGGSARRRGGSRAAAAVVDAVGLGHGAADAARFLPLTGHSTAVRHLRRTRACARCAAALRRRGAVRAA